HRAGGALIPRGLADKTLALIEAARTILAEIQPASVRGVCYQLFNRRLIPDMGKNSTDRVSRALTAAREQGLIDWNAIVDDTRAVDWAPTWDDPDSYIDSVAGGYRRDRWTSQPERVMIVSEKGTVSGILRPVIDEWGVNFAVYHGFGSASAIRLL